MSTAPAPPPKHRRPRAIQACNLCRSKKYKCDGNLPCLYCVKQNADCVFRRAETFGRDAASYSISYVKELEKRLELAESTLRRQQSVGSPQPASTSMNNAMINGGQSEMLFAPGPRPQLLQNQAHPSRPPDEEDGSTAELFEVNAETHAVEFHGNTSSLAFLEVVSEEYGSTPGEEQHMHERRHSVAESASLVTTFHNTAFRNDHAESPRSHEDLNIYFCSYQASLFLDTYFKNLHYALPIIDQRDILTRCEDLWHGRSHLQSRSFKALYFSLMSLGALIRTWTEHSISGMGRFEWSRSLFQKAEAELGRPGALNDLHAIQALVVMAKVCQNELNPNLSYIYLGLATRTALSAGLNRKSPSRERNKTSFVDDLSASKVWWGLYALEVEMSFALGRQDTTGVDGYHNRDIPTIDNSEFAIIPCMLPLSRIMREISVGIYLTKSTMLQKVGTSRRLEQEMDLWLASLPPSIRPGSGRDTFRSKPLSSEIWPKLQTLILKIRYLNVKMILLRPFLVHAAKLAQTQQLVPTLLSAINRCAIAASDTIDIIYDMFDTYDFFRTWWYNVTYVTFAASILLFYAAQDTLAGLIDLDFLSSTDKALGILDVMKDAVVATKVANFIRPIVAQLRERSAGRPDTGSPGKENNPLDLSTNGSLMFDPTANGRIGNDLDLMQISMDFVEDGLWNIDAGFEESFQNDSTWSVSCLSGS
ncbi:MAG: hypothetical protein CL912_22140 [Deltaproteobacteria bacterium]|nr:hypothetical protein [Deltaproteobacteria bacterium]